MTFTQEENKIPTTIGDLLVIIRFPVDENLVPVPNNEKTATFRIDVHDQSGQLLKQLRGNLVPHLTGAQVTTISNFLDDLRAQAVLEIL